MCHKFPSLCVGVVILSLVLATDVSVKERSLPKQDTPSDGEGDFLFQGDEDPEGSGGENEQFHNLDLEGASGSGGGPDDEDVLDDNGGSGEVVHTIEVEGSGEVVDTVEGSGELKVVHMVDLEGSGDDDTEYWLNGDSDTFYKENGDKGVKTNDKEYNVARENEIPEVEKVPQPPDDTSYDDNNQLNNNVHIMGNKHVSTASFFRQPGVLAAVIGGSVVGLLCAILLVMFIVYRMRKKDEGSYALDEPKRSPTSNSYNKSTREFYA